VLEYFKCEQVTSVLRSIQRNSHVGKRGGTFQKLENVLVYIQFQQRQRVQSRLDQHHGAILMKVLASETEGTGIFQARHRGTKENKTTHIKVGNLTRKN